MRGKDASSVQRAALDRIARDARRRSVGERLPESVRIEIGMGEHDPDDEDWDKVDDDAPMMAGRGPRERKHERRHGGG